MLACLDRLAEEDALRREGVEVVPMEARLPRTVDVLSRAREANERRLRAWYWDMLWEVDRLCEGRRWEPWPVLPWGTWAEVCWVEVLWSGRLRTKTFMESKAGALGSDISGNGRTAFGQSGSRVNQRQAESNRAHPVVTRGSGDRRVEGRRDRRVQGLTEPGVERV
jgi:hypothetical protein